MRDTTALRTLREFWIKHPQAETPLRGWYAEASRADWRTPADIKAVHRAASFLANNRVVFNIKGNDYRLVAAVRYTAGVLLIRFIGTHAEYDRIDATII
jgi:mRNA interferase HigB